METVIFEDIEALLLSSITVVGLFVILQAYIRPFKSTFVNILDLTFTANFLLLSSIVLYLNPTSNGYKKSDIAVNLLGYVAVSLFCIVIVYHVSYISKNSYWYISTLEWIWSKIEKYRERKLINTFISFSTIRRQVNLDRYHNMDDVNIPKEDRFQESLYED